MSGEILGDALLSAEMDPPSNEYLNPLVRAGLGFTLGDTNMTTQADVLTALEAAAKVGIGQHYLNTIII